MEDYDAYLFDWDGTIARTLEVWLREIYRLSLAYGLKVTPNDVARNFGDLSWSLKYGLPKAVLNQFLDETLESVLPQLPGVPLYDDVTRVLTTLKQRGKQLALVTTSRHDVLQSVFAQHQLLHDLFDHTITMHDVTKHKPDPEGINITLAALGVPKARALMLGDTEKDIGAAHNAGIDSVLYYPSLHEPMYDFAHLQSFQPTYTVRSWQAFLDTLQ